MTFNVSDFTSNLINDGARPNLFQVTMATLPAALGGNGTNSANAPARRLSFMARAAQIPGSSVGVVPMFYFGREIKLAGNRTFADWTITVINDEDFLVRNAMEQWSNGVQNLASTNGRVNPRDYQVDMTVHQLDRNGASVKIYKFIDAYPTTIGAIALDYEQQNQIETFDVEFQYNFFTSNSTEGNGISVNVGVNTPIGNFPIPIGQ